MVKTLPLYPKRDEFAETFKHAHNDATNAFGQPELVTIPKSPVDLPSVTSSSKTTNGNGVSSTPQVIQLSVTRMSRSHDNSVIHDTLETNNRQVSTPITQPLPFTSKKLVEKDISIVREISVLEDLALDNSSTSPDVLSLPLNSITTHSNPISPKDNPPVRKVEAKHKTSMNSFFVSLATPQVVFTEVPERVRPVWRPARRSSKSGDSLPSTPAPDNIVSTAEVLGMLQPRKLQPWQPLNIMESSNLLAQFKISPESLPSRTGTLKDELRPRMQTLHEDNLSDVATLPREAYTEVPEKVQPRKLQPWQPLSVMESSNPMARAKTNPELLPSQTTATLKPLLLPQLQTLRDDNSSDVPTLLGEAYIERQQALQTRPDKALAELRDVQAENKRLTSENQSQQREISQLKIALDEAKHEQDNSLNQMKDQLRVANSSLTLLNMEKKKWQDKLDSMQHKLIAAERQVRCLDHLTRHKLESRQEADYVQPKRRGLLASIPASTDVIGAMLALNEEIYQTCVQFAEDLERTAVYSSQPKLQVQKVLGVHLTAMMEDQAKRTTSGGYDMLLVQTVLEVFMTHWCSSIIEAFYPQQESFTDLLVQLSAETTKASGK